MSGDIILNVEDRIISNMSNFIMPYRSTKPCSQVTLNIKRTTGTSDKEMEIKVVLEEKSNKNLLTVLFIQPLYIFNIIKHFTLYIYL